MFSDADVTEVRHVVQRILVPCVFVIGLLGNSVSIYVLTRKRMRCTTNIYLTALAITDIAYLTFQLILSLKHYEYMQYHCELYWQLYGITIWLCDACAYISIYIAMCFTIERFIAIRYPLKRQTFCTESLAKKVIAGVTLFCLLSTLSTAFEHTYQGTTIMIDGFYKPCNQTLANFSPKPGAIEQKATTPSSELEMFETWGSGSGDGSASVMPNVNIPTSPTAEEDYVAAAAPTEYESVTLPANINTMNSGTMKSNNNTHDTFAFNVTEYCQNATYFKNIPSALGYDEVYGMIWSMFTLVVYVLLPLLVLSTFNCFLIMLVHRSKSLRGNLTNANSIRRTKRKSTSGLTATVSQENRVTITLIAVVLLFIVCQLPWAIYLLVIQIMEIEINVQLVAGNIFNFLAAINAAANFFLYCVLSDKYRKTVRELITNGYRYRNHRHTRNYNNNNNNNSLYTQPHTTATLTHINGDDGSSNLNRNRSSSSNKATTTSMGRLI